MKKQTNERTKERGEDEEWRWIEQTKYEDTKFVRFIFNGWRGSNGEIEHHPLDYKTWRLFDNNILI